MQKLSQWAEKGLTDVQIAHNMGIGYTTLRDWKSKYPSILTALKRGKDVADQEVENSMYKSAIGYFVYEEVEETRMNRKKHTEETVIKRTKKWCPPSTTAQIFWLKNRQPERWRDKVVQEIGTADHANYGIAIISERAEIDMPSDVQTPDE